MSVSTISDNELLYMIYQRNNIAFDIFTKRYERFIRYWISKKFLNLASMGYETDDLVAAGFTALYSAVDVYVPKKGVFYSFAKVCVLRALINKIRNESKFRNGIFSIDQPINSEIGPATYNENIESESWISKPELFFTINEKVEDYLETSTMKKPDLARKIFAYKLLGYTVKEISEKLEVSEITINLLLRQRK